MRLRPGEWTPFVFLGGSRLLDIIFYFQMLFVLALIGYAFYSKSWSVFGLAGVFTILTGAMLASGEQIEYPTGAYTLIEGYGGDENVNVFMPDYNSFSTSNSAPISMWSQVMMYGGFVFLIFSFILAIREINDRKVEDELNELV